jgi:hypothetical protein
LSLPPADSERITVVVVVLRLSVSRQGQLRHGELVDVNERHRGRFSGWDGLVPAVARFVAQEVQAAGSRETHDRGVG